MTFRFAEPGWLFLGMLVPLVFWRRNANQGAIPFSDIAFIEGEPHSSPRLRFRWLPDFLRSLWLLLLILSMARPQFAVPASAITDTGPSIYLLIDVSGSMGTIETTMAAETITRLDEAKMVAKRLLEVGSSGLDFAGRIGVITIAATPEILVPLTSERRFATSEIVTLEVDKLENRTNLGDAMVLAMDRLVKGKANPGAIVLMTDGGHNVPAGMSPGEAARIAEAMGIKVHAVSFGSIATTTSAEEFARDKASLRQIAEITGGSFQEAARFEDVSSVIDQLLGGLATKPRVIGYQDWQDRYPATLLMALFVWCLETILRARWSRVGLH